MISNFIALFCAYLVNASKITFPKSCDFKSNINIDCNNWCDKNKMCEKSYAYPREIMPQLSNNSQIEKILTPKYVYPENLIPFQKNIYINKVSGLVNYFFNNNIKSFNKQFNERTKIVIAKNIYNNYVIIDGHHRWASAIEIQKMLNKKFKLLCFISPFDDITTWKLLHVIEKSDVKYNDVRINFWNVQTKII